MSTLRTVLCSLLRQGATKTMPKQQPASRPLSTTSCMCQQHKEKPRNRPVPPDDLPRTAGICSMMRLPIRTDTDGLDACFVGIPLDVGCSYRTGTRFGPRAMRNESLMMKEANKETGAVPFDYLNVADVGDVYFTMFDLPKATRQIREAYRRLIRNGCKTLTMGGDHTLSYPILQAIKEKYGRVCLIHIDAHPDTDEHKNGSTICHGTPFYLAVEEELIDPNKTFQIGLRGTGKGLDDYAYGIEKGFTVIPARDCYHKNMFDIMSTIRSKIGDDPVYLSFDIDGIDPAFCPGTGTPEIGGLTSVQALEIVRGCKGLNIVGCDLVEVAPAYDPTGITALTGANLLYEMLCVLPGVEYKPIPK